MSLKDVYQRFLADPKSAPLAADVSLIYVTTTTRFDKPDSVVNHLVKQQLNVVEKKSEEVIGVVEGSDSLCLDVDTTVEFLSGGGAYLPSIDDNFLADRVATFPTIHIVRFNSENQIQQVRIYWDQASLLKQVEVIGSRARGWPIRDAKDQTRLIKSSVSAQPAAASAPQPKKEEETKFSSPGKRRVKDPYTADSLTELLSPGKDRIDPVHPPRAPSSAKPPARDLGELFVGHEDNDAGLAGTPTKKPAAPKVGAGKNFAPSRIFDDDETVAAEGGHRQIAYRPNPNRFNHFEIGGDNSDREIKDRPSRPGSRQVAHWDFESFSTPEKPTRQPRGQELRHFDFDHEPQLETPPARPRVVQPRRDAETHFQMTDEDSAKGPRIISSYQNKGLGLYKSSLFDDDEPGQDKPKAPLSSIPQNGNRRNDFESHFTVGDNSPVDGKADHENKPVATDRLKAVKNMAPSWDTYDVSPQKPAPRRSARNVNQRSWDLDN